MSRDRLKRDRLKPGARRELRCGCRAYRSRSGQVTSYHFCDAHQEYEWEDELALAWPDPPEK